MSSLVMSQWSSCVLLFCCYVIFDVIDGGWWRVMICNCRPSLTCIHYHGCNMVIDFSVSDFINGFLDPIVSRFGFGMIHILEEEEE
ncbi:unnamed protein product [Brassica napus]|uniref:(rape) hypothetical protein n=1 Tax=Brassica napus TaxID=3708 RepID=A0A817AVY6_BRANA|nr:unnamed protein product [Brassica napus]